MADIKEFLRKRAIVQAITNPTWEEYVTAVVHLREIVYEVLGEVFPDQEELRQNSPVLFGHVVTHIKSLQAQKAQADTETKGLFLSVLEGSSPVDQIGGLSSVNPGLTGLSVTTTPYPLGLPPDWTLG